MKLSRSKILVLPSVNFNQISFPSARSTQTSRKTSVDIGYKNSTHHKNKILLGNHIETQTMRQQQGSESDRGQRRYINQSPQDILSTPTKSSSLKKFDIPAGIVQYLDFCNNSNIDKSKEAKTLKERINKQKGLRIKKLEIKTIDTLEKKWLKSSDQSFQVTAIDVIDQTTGYGRDPQEESKYTKIIEDRSNIDDENASKQNKILWNEAYWKNQSNFYQRNGHLFNQDHFRKLIDRQQSIHQNGLNFETPELIKKRSQNNFININQQQIRRLQLFYKASSLMMNQLNEKFKKIEGEQ